MSSVLFPNHRSRRDFLKTAGLGATVLAGYLMTGGCEDFFERIRNRPLRRRIQPGNAASDDAVEWYRRGVLAMKGLPAGDRRNWISQADIHRNFCPHSSWMFFPWHRSYLFYLEQICRDQGGAPDSWALPYWHWSLDRALPAQFWVPGSALLDNTRVITSASLADINVVGPSEMETILQEDNFLIFGGNNTGSSGTLSQGPHGYIHAGFVRGNMRTTGPAAQDPIFYAHHSFIDYCWNHWNLDRGFDNTNDPAWQNVHFTEFADKTGVLVDSSVIATLLMPLLSYRYEDSPMGTLPAPKPLMMADKKAFEKAKKVIEAGADVKLDFRQKMEVANGVQLSPQRGMSLKTDLRPAQLDRVLGASADERLLLTLRDIEMPSGSDAFIRVFVNAPNAGPSTSTDDPHFAGSFFIFQDGEGNKNHKKGQSNVVDLTKTVRELSKNGLLAASDPLSVSLVAVPIGDAQTPPLTAPLALRNVEIGLSPVVTTSKLREFRGGK